MIRVVFAVAIMFVLGCGSNAFRITGGNISREERAALQAAEDQKKQRQQLEAEREAELAEERHKAKVAALSDTWAESLRAWKDAYMAFAISMRDAQDPLDDICDAAEAKTDAERQLATKYYESFATAFRRGNPPDHSEIKRRHDGFARELRGMAKLAVIEARAAAQAASPPPPTPTPTP